MPRHEIPTHLDVQDRILGPLTARDALFLLTGAAAAYGLGTESRLPLDLRIPLGAVAATLSAVLALVRVDNRPLDEWLASLAAYLVTPRRATWRPCRTAAEPESREARGWRHRMPATRWSDDSRGGAAAPAIGTVRQPR
jgi:hypothetical protein